MEVVGVIIFILLCIYIDWASRKRWRHLPSPWLRVPFLGHLEFIFNISDPVNETRRLYNVYSKNGLCYTSFMNVHNVLVGDYDTLRYLLNHPHVQNRVTNFTGPLYKQLMENRGQKEGYLQGIMHSQGEIWREQRKFTVRTLREFGFGRGSMEDLVQDEFSKFSDHLDTYKGEYIEISGLFNLPVINVLWEITTGEIFSYQDPKMAKIIHQLAEYVQNTGRSLVVFLICLPWLGKLFPQAMGRKNDIQVNKEIVEMMKSLIENHLRSLDVKAPRDFIDSYLIEVASTTDPNSSFFGVQGYENLTNTLTDLFQAGAETTSTTLSWAIMYLVVQTDVQTNMQVEIDSVLGNRDVKMTDKENLPYCRAVIYEVQRCGNILPHGGARKTEKAVEVNGMIIPEDTFITPVFAEILQGSHWVNGEIFDPTRFLDENGQLRKDEHLIPFAVGRRYCPGESLAKAQLFVFITGLVQKYNIRCDPDYPPLAKDYLPGFTRSPKSFKIKLTMRK